MYLPQKTGSKVPTFSVLLNLVIVPCIVGKVLNDSEEFTKMMIDALTLRTTNCPSEKMLCRRKRGRDPQGYCLGVTDKEQPADDRVVMVLSKSALSMSKGPR